MSFQSYQENGSLNFSVESRTFLDKDSRSRIYNKQFDEEVDAVNHAYQQFNTKQFEKVIVFGENSTAILTLPSEWYDRPIIQN